MILTTECTEYTEWLRRKEKLTEKLIRLITHNE